jgi:hypothetical protein
MTKGIVSRMEIHAFIQSKSRLAFWGNRRCGEMADAQDLKFEKWPFLAISYDFLPHPNTIANIIQNSLFACPHLPRLTSHESSTKSSTNRKSPVRLTICATSVLLFFSEAVGSRASV